MLKPRKSLIGLESTSDYHCISRCVRRAFLCGEDAYTGRSFEHRRGWIEGRLLELAQIFAIEVCGYSLIATHSHRVLHVDQPLAESWTAREVVERWHQLFSGTELSERYLREESLLEVEQQQLEDLAETWRERLTSVSWLLTHRAAQRAHRPQGRRGGCVHRALLGGAVSVLRLSDTCVRKYHLDGVLIPGPARRPSRARLSRLRGPQPGACRHRRDPRGLRLHLHPATDSHTTAASEPSETTSGAAAVEQALNLADWPALAAISPRWSR